MNATVNLQPDRLDVWVGTQDAGQALEMAARFSGLKPVAVVATDTYWRAKRAQAGVIFLSSTR